MDGGALTGGVGEINASPNPPVGLATAWPTAAGAAVGVGATPSAAIAKTLEQTVHCALVPPAGTFAGSILKTVLQLEQLTFMPASDPQLPARHLGNPVGGLPQIPIPAVFWRNSSSQ